MGKSALDVLIVNPGQQATVYQSLGSTLSAIEAPIWAGLIATFARVHGLSVELLDANALGLGAHETTEQIADLKPLLTVVVVYGQNPSASTQVMPSAGALCTTMKQVAPDIRILLVGGHVAALPERTLREEAADFVSGGEGPFTILDLVQALKSDTADFSKVRGLYYREGKEIVSTPPAPLVEDLDRLLPSMAWDLLPMEKYRAHNWHCFGHLDQRQPYASLYTTLGCPFHCSYCCIQTPFRSGERVLGYKQNVNSYRFWSAQSIIAQIDTLVTKHNVHNIKFADELFVLNKRHINAICDLIVERGYDLNIWAYARIDSVKEDILETLKRAGINWLCFGIESASERVRNDVHKEYDQDMLFKVIESVRTADINVIANYMFGLPEDNLESMQATLDTAVELNCEFANFYCAMAYPGSKLYDIAVREKWVLPESWSGYSQHARDTLPLPTKYIPGIEVLRFRDEAFQTYFNSPTYLNMITDKFGSSTVDHIRFMASHTLERTQKSCSAAQSRTAGAKE